MQEIKTAIQCPDSQGNINSFLYIPKGTIKMQCSPSFSSLPTLFKWAKENGFKDKGYDYTHVQKFYNLVAQNLNTGELTLLTAYAMPHKECMIMKSKLTPHDNRAILLIEVIR